MGKLPLEKVSTDIVKLLKRMVSNFEVEADNKGIRLEFEAESPGPIVTLADPNRITQVFVNLLGNAFRYTPPGGTVRVTVGRDATAVRVTVSDTGAGIPKEHLPHILTDSIVQKKTGLEGVEEQVLDLRLRRNS